jgi:hypothetical protein
MGKQKFNFTKSSDKRHNTSIRNIRSYRGADGDTDDYLVVASLS